MRTEYNKIEARTTLTHDLRLHGVWVGDCTVTNGANLQLHGIVTGNLTVHDDATATVHGTVSGDLVATGRVHVKGIVTGRATGPGLTTASDAHVGH